MKPFFHRLNRLWRAAMTGFCFALFGIGGLLLSRSRLGHHPLLLPARGLETEVALVELLDARELLFC